MKCPKCGTPEQARVRVCRNCGTSYASVDLLEYRQLEFLLKETANWSGTAELRAAYQKRFDELAQRIMPPLREPAPAIAATEPIAPAPQPVALAPQPIAAPSSAALSQKPKAESVPFDQWLLSERNIKTALYSGGALLLLAGLIFALVNWERFGGEIKLLLTLVVTALLYAGGYVLNRRPMLKLGGLALLGIASGFVPLNFLVAYIYIFGPLGMSVDAMWLTGSLVSLLLYAFSAFRTRAPLFTYMSIFAVASITTAIIRLFHLSATEAFAIYSLAALAFILLARASQGTSFDDYARSPLLIAAHISTPILFLASAVFGLISLRCTYCIFGNPWLGIFAMFVGVVCYTATDWFWHRVIVRVVIGATFALTFLLTLAQWGLNPIQIWFAASALTIAYLGIGFGLQRITRSLEAGLPFVVEAQLAAPFVFIINMILWVFTTGSIGSSIGYSWTALAAMFIGVAFYLMTDALYHQRAARWAASFLFIVAFIFSMVELRLTSLQTGIALKILALVYLAIGLALERREKSRTGGMPLYAAAYGAAVFVSMQSLFAFPRGLDDLAKALLADVVILVISAGVHRNYNWIYGAAWLFIAPFSIYAYLNLTGSTNIGIALGVLMVLYVAGGYVVGNRAIRLAGPFLTAAAFLSVIVPILTWYSSNVQTLSLAVIAVLYTLVAVWLNRPWLVIAALGAVDWGAIAVSRIFFDRATESWWRAIASGYGVLVLAMVVGAVLLRRTELKKWALPLYVFAALNFVASYLTGLAIGGTLVIVFSAWFAVIASALAWEERAAIARLMRVPFLSYVAILLIFIGHLYALNVLRYTTNWQPITAALCALFIFGALLLRPSTIDSIFAVPLRRLGFVLMSIPFVGLVMADNSLTGAITFGIASAAFFVDGVANRVDWISYLGGATVVIALWFLLNFGHVRETQAFVVPAGVWLLLIGWNEARRNHPRGAMAANYAGLLVLMGTAFVQSLNGVNYSILLLVEGIAAIFWGVRTHSRTYVQVGIVSMIVNALAQFGPGFVQMERWIQLGTIGSLLLLVGLAALFRREQILIARKNLTEGWKQWNV